MRLLKAEKDALLALAEQQFDSSAEFIEAMAAELDRVRGERRVHFALVRYAGVVTVAGCYSTGGQARKAIEKSGGEKGWVVPGRSAEGWSAHLAELEKPAAPKGDFATVTEDALLFKRGWDGKQATRGSWG